MQASMDGRGSEVLFQALERQRTELRRGSSSLKRKFPMMVLPVHAFFDLDRLETHETIEDKLVQYDESMGQCLFLSHTWLGYKVPDPSNAKFDLLRELLRRILAGELQVCPHWTTETVFGPLHISGKRLQAALTNGFIWLECAKPRALARTDSASDQLARCPYTRASASSHTRSLRTPPPLSQRSSTEHSLL